MVEALVGESEHSGLVRLVTEFGWRVDNGSADTIHELFVDNGELTLGSTVMRGREEIAAWGRARVNAGGRSRHVCTNMRFVTTDGDQVDGSTLLTVYLADDTTPDPTVPAAVCEYQDRFIRTSEGWRFVSRRSVVNFSRPSR
jgi:hypothetical protein